MKGFLLYIVVLMVMILSLQWFGDLFYTSIYNKGSYRNKVMWARDLRPADSLDYIILGSSRAKYHVDPLQILEATGRSGINFGYNSSHPFDSYLMLNELTSRTLIDTVFFQIDHSFRTQTPDEIGSLPWLPYLREPLVYEPFKEHEGYSTLYWLPMIRYQKYESELGFRNVVLSLAGKEPTFLKTRGFEVRDAAFREMHYEPVHILNDRNKAIDKMIALCEDKEITLILFTAPVYSFHANYDRLDQLPNYTDFSEQYRSRSYFSDEIHLNAEGAHKFTELFIQNYFD